ncbi:MAG: SDR family oxidoreductase [Oscillospiraceae bacterium]|nr:SDR family oxidoreductase [Oscillospiraceae bacterium]
MGDYLKGKVAIVTGSGQGIGRAVAKALAAQGCKVVTNNRAPWDGVIPIDEEKFSKISKEMQEWALQEYPKYYGDAERTAADIIAAGGEAIAVYGDISEFETGKKLVDAAIEKWGHIDIVVNIAAAFGFSPVEKMPRSMWDRVNTVKPTGYFYVIRHAVQHMIDQKWGRIINCASPAWTGGTLRQCEYCASNAGVVGMTWGLAAELQEYGITANTFAPAAKTRASVDMEIYNNMEKEETNTIGGAPEISYDGTEAPENFADFIAWLAGDEAADVTGQVFMTMGKFIGRYSIPTIAGAMFADGAQWTVEEAGKKAENLFKPMPAPPFGAPPAE